MVTLLGTPCEYQVSVLSSFFSIALFHCSLSNIYLVRIALPAVVLQLSAPLDS